MHDPKSDQIHPFPSSGIRLAEGECPSENTVFELFDGTSVDDSDGQQDLSAAPGAFPKTNENAETITDDLEPPTRARSSALHADTYSRNLVMVCFGATVFCLWLMTGVLLAKLGG